MTPKSFTVAPSCLAELTELIFEAMSRVPGECLDNWLKKQSPLNQEAGEGLTLREGDHVDAVCWDCGPVCKSSQVLPDRLAKKQG